MQSKILISDPANFLTDILIFHDGVIQHSSHLHNKY